MNIQLYVIRRENRLRQKDVARKVGMCEKSYQLKESGKRQFTIEEGLRLARVFNCTLDDLFGKESRDAS